MLKKTVAIFLLCFLMSSSLLFALPQPRGFVNDLEGIVENVGELEERLVNFEKQTGIEIAVLTTPDFGDTYLEDYASKVFQEWGLGKEGEDNGVLILVSKEQRQSRIEVGYGLEPVLTDGLTGRIQDVSMIPSFRQEKYSEGINNGVDSIVAVLGGEEVSGVTTDYINEDFEALGCLGIMFVGFLFLFPNPFVGAAVGGVLGFLFGTAFFGLTGGIVAGISGAILGFLVGFLARMVPAPIRQGIAYSMISSASRGGGRSSGFGGFGGGSSGGGGSSRSW